MVHKLIVEDAFPGANNTLLQIRVSESLHEAIKAEAKARKQDIPDLLRDAFALYMIPGALRRRIEERMELDSKDRAVLEAYQQTLRDLATESNTIASLNEDSKKAHIKKEAMKFLTESDHRDKLIKELAEQVVQNLFGEVQGTKTKQLVKILSEKDEKGGHK